MRKKVIYNVIDIDKFKHQLLLWSDNFETSLFLDSNNFHVDKGNLNSRYSVICAIGEMDSTRIDSEDKFKELQDFIDSKKDWVFGHLSYDLKNSIEDLSSTNLDGIGIPDLYFFQPKFLFIIHGNEIEIHFHETTISTKEIDLVFSKINESIIPEIESPQDINLKSRISKSEYISKVNIILDNIQKGDIFELNFCQEFYSEDCIIRPREIYENLMRVSPTPFSSYYKFKEFNLLSASPERYIQKSGQKIISQPIKGTIRRGKTVEEDEQLKYELEHDPKERSENIMIVDLVRNDLSKSAERGSVMVEELCKIYTYPLVHQMISTVSCIHNPEVQLTDIIRNSYPMGSMTGAPKVRAMQLIEDYESTKRGLFSGSVGYISPEGDMDFNVIIRSIIYNSKNKYLSFQVGSAITCKSEPESEYEECLVKASAMKKALKI